MKRIFSLCLVLMLAFTTPVLGDTVNPEPPIDEPDYVITEIIPPSLDYKGGGNFPHVARAQGFDDEVAIISLERPWLAHVDGHGGRNDYPPDMHYSIVNTKGEIVFRPEYQSILLTNGYIQLLPFRDASDKSLDKLLFYEYYDRRGSLIAKVSSGGKDTDTGEYTRYGTLSDGLYSVSTYEDNSYLYGYKNPQGDWIIPPNFLVSWAGDFIDGYAVMYSDATDSADGKGLIDKKGNRVVPTIFNILEYDGLAHGPIRAWETGKKWGCIDITGEYVIPPEYDDISRFDHGYAWAIPESAPENEKGWKNAVIIDATGNVVARPDFTLTSFFSTCRGGFSEGLSYLDGIGYVDTSGNIVIDYKEKIEGNYGRCSPFLDGFATVELGRRHPSNVYFSGFTNDQIYGIIDRKGDLLPLDDYDNVFYPTEPGMKPNGYVITEKDGKLGVIRITEKSKADTADSELDAVMPVVTPASREKTMKVANTDHVNLRAGAGTNYSVIAVLPSGTEVTILSAQGGWYKVIYQGKTGYIREGYLQ